MTFNIGDLPTVKEQLARDVEALKGRHAQRAQVLAGKQAAQYARAPAASGAQPIGDRPPAMQRSDR